MRIHHLFQIVVLLLGATLAIQGCAAPKARALPGWEMSSETSREIIDHAAWQAILDRYLDAKHPSDIHRFRYAAVTPQDKARLQGYLDRLQSLDPRRYSRAEQFAYWVNLYNALTVDLILDHYPVKSIRKIHKGFIAFGPWDDPIASVAGETLTLNNIEHGILRPRWRDPRIHYAVNCASLGCPNLAAQAYTADNTERLLEEGARAYVNHPRGVSFQGDRLTVSSIYHWYQEDFGGTDSGVKAHLKRYAAPELAARLEAHHGGFDHDYDWGLNEP